MLGMCQPDAIRSAFARPSARALYLPPKNDIVPKKFLYVNKKD